MGENEPNLSRIKFLSMLSRAVKKHKISYIGAHTGWGKTTAILQWMKIQKNKNIYLSALDDNFAEELEKAPSSREQIIVLDDIQTLTESEEQEKLLSFIAGRNNSFVIIGRSQAVPFLKPFEITRQMVCFSEKELALDAEEISELLNMNGIDHTPETAEKLLQLSRGWAVSIMQFIKKLKAGKPFDEGTVTEVKYELYDYFDFKLFIHWDSEIQNFLMAVLCYRPI